MSYQTFFKRYEIKYLLSAAQRELLLQTMAPYMDPDPYGHSTIRNIYFDTDSYQLIRQSLERPVYKEKLRIRSYVKANRESPVFVELKKKYQSVVYKRRTVLPEQQAMDWLTGNGFQPTHTQIVEEIEYFRTFYASLHPVVFLSYERDAFYSHNAEGLRITFDENILCRMDALSLESDIWGTPLLKNDLVLMEIKTSGGIPLWLTHFLTQQQLYKTTFSKYGTAYSNLIFKPLSGGMIYA